MTHIFCMDMICHPLTYLVSQGPGIKLTRGPYKWLSQHLKEEQMAPMGAGSNNAP